MMKLLMDKTVLLEIMNWIDRISTPSDKIGGFAVCPFARAAKAGVKIVEVDSFDSIVIPQEEFEVIIIKLPDSLSIEQLNTGCEESNQRYPLLIFLPDHKDRTTDINGVATNNGHYNLVLCQPRDKLANARQKLYRTDYYSFWSKEYLEEILGDDIVNLD